MKTLFLLVVLVCLFSHSKAQQIIFDLEDPAQVLVDGEKKRVSDLEDALKQKVKFERERQSKEAYNAGVELVGKSKCTEALKLFDKAYGIEPDFVEAYMAAGECRLELGKYKQAVEDFKIALDINPDLDVAWLGIGRAFMGEKNREESLKAFEKALAIKPNNPLVASQIALIHIEKQDYAKAIQFLEKATAQDSRLSAAWNDLGSCKRMVGNLVAAEQAYSQAIVSNPTYALALANRASVRVKLKKLNEAIEDYTLAIENDSKALYLNNRGNAKYEKGDYKGAELDFTSAIEKDNNYVFAYLNRAAAKFKLADYQGAVKDCDLAIKLKPDFAEAFLSRGNAKEMLRDEQGACDDWAKASELGIQAAQSYRFYCEN